MKTKSKWWLAPLMMCLLAANATAQGDIEVLQFCPSYVWHYPDIKTSNNTLICGDNDYRVILAQYKDPATGINRHTFVIKDFYTNIESAYATYFNALDSADYNIIITDMKMYNYECYFCGTITYPYLGFLSDEYVTHGIIGHFSPHALQTLSGDIKFKIIENTKSLSRLAVTGYDDIIAKVCAIGIEEAGQKNCIVEVNNTIANGYTYTLGTIANDPGTYFSDILATRDSITLLAQYYCQNDYDISHPNYDFNHQVFLIDRSSKQGFCHDFNTIPIHYMAHYYLNTDANFNFHYKLAPMRLYQSDYTEDSFGLAFGVKDNYSSVGAIRVFSFPHKMKYERCVYYKTGHNAKVLDIGNRTMGLYIPSIISVDNTFTNSVLSRPNWDDSYRSVPMRSSYEYKLCSLEPYRYHRAFDITCYNRDNELVLFFQNIDSLHITCFNKDCKQFTELPPKQGAMLITDWDFPVIDEEITFGTANIIDKKKVSPKENCKNCNNQN